MFWDLMRRLYKKDPPPTPEEIDEAYRWHEWRCNMERFWQKLDELPPSRQRNEFREHHSKNNYAMRTMEPDLWRSVTSSWSYSQTDCYYRVTEDH